MSEQATPSTDTYQDNPQEYLELHPDAVEDSRKAEVMAYASRIQEEGVVQARKDALEAASNIGDSNYRGPGSNRTAAHEATSQVERAQAAREQADRHAAAAAEIYDQVKDL